MHSNVLTASAQDTRTAKIPLHRRENSQAWNKADNHDLEVDDWIELWRAMHKIKGCYSCTREIIAL